MVLQRWQNVYLFLAAVSIAIFAFLPILQIQTSDAVYNFSILSMEQIGIPTTDNVELNQTLVAPIYNWLLFTMNMVITVLILINITKFKNLKLQKSLCYINLALTVSFWAATSLYVASLWNSLKSVSQSNEGEMYLAFLIPALTIIFLFLAIRGIKKDTRILNSYDRIR